MPYPSCPFVKRATELMILDLQWGCTLPISEKSQFPGLDHLTAKEMRNKCKLIVEKYKRMCANIEKKKKAASEATVLLGLELCCSECGKWFLLSSYNSYFCTWELLLLCSSWQSKLLCGMHCFIKVGRTWFYIRWPLKLIIQLDSEFYKL